MAVVMLISFSEGDVRFVAWFARLLPGYGISSALSTFAQISMLNVKCNLLTPEQKQLVCKPGDSWGSGLEEMKECCGKIWISGIVVFILNKLSKSFFFYTLQTSAVKKDTRIVSKLRIT